MTQAEKAEKFRALHANSEAFVIPNPWDAGSARIVDTVAAPAYCASAATPNGR